MSEPIIFGLDVYPHYSRSFNNFSNKYYAVVISQGKVRTRILRVSKHRLLQLVHRYKPSIISIDNIFELAPDLDSLQRLFLALPLETKIIQATGMPKKAISLQKAAIQNGFEPPLKTSPIQEAEICAKLAPLNVGAEIRVLGNETEIVVSRNVSLGAGGSSQSRYRRQIHSSILNMTRRIERALRREGIDYDIFPEKADYGLERAAFTVYAPKIRLRGVIHSGYGEYIQVKIKSVYKKQIEFVDRNPSTSTSSSNNAGERLIVGIDPGTTCGLAVITFDGIPVYINSNKGLTRGEILNLVMNLGKVVVVASDVVNVPTFVSKLAKTLDAVIFTPITPIKVVEKKKVTQEYFLKYDLNPKDSHARDALAAAIKAFQHYQNKFRQIESEVKKTQIPVQLDEVKTLVIKGHPIQRAIGILSLQTSTDIEQEEVQEVSTLSLEKDKIRNLQTTISLYKEQVKRLKESNERLVTQTESLLSQIAMLQESLVVERRKDGKELRRDRKYRVLKREIEKLREQFSRSQQGVGQSKKLPLLSSKKILSKDKSILIKPVESFTKESIEQAFLEYNIGLDDILILLNSNGGGISSSEQIAKKGVKAVVICSPIVYDAEETFKKYNILILSAKDLRIEWVEGYPYVGREEFEIAFNEVKKRKELELKEKIQEIIKEYRNERTRI